MRISKLFSVAVAAVALAAISQVSNATTPIRYWGGMGGDGDATVSLTILPSGAATTRVDSATSRESIEAMLRAVQKYKNRQFGLDPDEAAEPAPTKEEEAEAKPMTDAEIEKGLRDQMTQAEEASMGRMNTGKIEKIEVTKENVRVVLTNSFEKLTDMLANSYSFLPQTGFSHENIRFETDTNSNLKVTFIPHRAMKRYAKRSLDEWRITGKKTEFKMTLPGKIISTGYPETSGNTTGFKIDSASEESLKAAEKFWSDEIVVIAEPGGLKLDKPLDLRTAQRSLYAMARPETVSDVPITEGGAGHTAEAISVTATTVYKFPGAEEEDEMAEYGDGEGTMVRAKIFGPKDRTLQAVTDLRVLEAVDDKGRKIQTEAPDADPYGLDNISHESYGSRGKQQSSRQVAFRLGLPEPDAKSIEEMTVEAVVQTVGAWKELVHPLEEGKTNEVDLSAVMPGAKLELKKVTMKGGQIVVEGIAKGTPDVHKLDIQIKSSGDENSFHSFPQHNMSGMQGGNAKDQRRVMLRAFGMGRNGAGPAEVSLQVRLPTDTKRERVKFKLSGLDLD